IVSNDGTAATLDVPLQAASIQPQPQPDIALSPMSLDFGEIPAWTTSSQSTLLWNEGDAPLQVTSIALVGADSLEFAIPGGGAGFSLSPGDSTTLEVLFAPVTTGSKSAALRISSDDPDENPLDVALAGVGVAPLEGMVAFEESVRGDSEGSSTVTTSSSISAVEGHLYLATVASKGFASITSLTGLDLDWTAVRTQCSGRDQTGVQVWMASGSPSAGPVTATLENSVDSAVIIVSRYSGVDLDTPFGSIGSVNTNGFDGGCSGGEDDTEYDFEMTTTVQDALLFVAVAMRNRQHTPGPGFVLRDESLAGAGGAISSLAVLDQEFETPGVVSVEGTFSGDVDYAVVAIELRPFVGIAKNAPLEVDTVSRPGLLLCNGIGGEAAWVELASPRPQPARVRIYDVRGRLLTTLWNGPMPAGRTRIEWVGADRRAIAAGIYFVRAEIGAQRFTGKVLVLR
ncbi:MAG: choice-of-anchor D domain-containing protein, partial [Candidatus Latescibacterota bacterium]